MNPQQANQFVKDLYQAVDSKNLAYLEQKLADRTRFRLGNHAEVTDKTQILQSNEQFFSSIQSMRHEIADVLVAPVNSSRAKIACHGFVEYTRLDGSHHSVTFSTMLDIQDGLITDYLVFVDISEL